VPIDVSDSFVEDWLGDDLDTLHNAFERGRNVAVVSEPFGGRDRVVDYAVENLAEEDVERKRFEPVHTDGEKTPEKGEGTHVYEDSQHLYTRRIDGYGCVDAFLDDAASRGKKVVTSWNVFSWRYVSRVRDADKVFSSVVEVPSLDTDVLDRFLSEGEPPRPEEYADDEGSSFVRREVELPFFEDRSVSVPWRLDHENMSPREVAIEHVRSRSDGNPGVAEAMWEKMLDEGYDAVSEGDDDGGESRNLVDSFGKSKEGLDDSAAFALRTVVSKEEVSKDELRETAGVGNVERTVRSLSDKGIVSENDGFIEPEPEKLPGVVSTLKGRSTLW